MKWTVYFFCTIILLLFSSLFVQGQSFQLDLYENHDGVLDLSEVAFYFLNVTDTEIFSLSVSTVANIGIIFYDSYSPDLNELSYIINSNFTNNNVYFQRSITNGTIDIFYSVPSYGILAIYSNSINNPSGISVALISSYSLTQVSFTTPFSSASSNDATTYSTSVIAEGDNSFLLLMVGIVAFLFLGGIVYSSRSKGHSYPLPRKLPTSVKSSHSYSVKPISTQKKTKVSNSFCPNCGAQLLAIDVFCTECGTKVK